MLNRTRIIPLLTLFALFAFLWLLPDGAAWLDRRPDEAWRRVQSTGVIRFATDASYHPFEGVGGDGIFYGLDIDIAHEVARRVGARAEFTNVGVDALYDALRVGQADASLSALPIDSARLGQWAYSQPYFDAGLVLIARLDAEPMALGDLPGRIIAVALGSDGDARLRDYQRRAAGVTAARFESAPDALQAVADGRADAAIVDGVTARRLLPARFADLRVAAQVTNEAYAVAVWGESAELLGAINRALEMMQADGTLIWIIDKWMRQ
jgi:ABC-type amino acid transport substrate-binding protein